MYQLFQSVVISFMSASSLPASISIFTIVPLVEETLLKLGILNVSFRSKGMRLIVGIVPSILFAVIEQLSRNDPNPYAWALTVPMHILCSVVGARFRWAGLAYRIIMHAVWNIAAVHVLPILNSDTLNSVVMFGILGLYVVIAIVVWVRK